MKKRTQLPPDERREQIVAGALNVFSRKGFDATTNKDIAAEAGIASPGLIYHYFADKASLLRATLEMHFADAIDRRSPDILMQLSLEDGLRHLMREFLRDLDNPVFVSFIRVLLGEAMRRPECAKILYEVMVQRMFSTLTVFFKSHIEQGNMRNIDPVVATIRFSGSTLSVMMMREVLKIPEVCALDRAALEKQLVDDFISGILP